MKNLAAKKYMKADGTYVTDSRWLIDPNGDEIYEIYIFNANGYLCIETDPATNYNRWGFYNTQGQMITNNYKGIAYEETGPYEIVKGNDGYWHCVNGTIPNDLSACSIISDDYAMDASRIVMWVNAILQASQVSVAQFTKIKQEHYLKGVLLHHQLFDDFATAPFVIEILKRKTRC